ncbi:MAG: hypothetical protein DRO67_00345 [Candidatus Asgardarchaeum californiense]|nr:MAG: hypothetical protein DRO67_00345 [Candidatus Asgardarchaeum californiense]
MGLGKLKDYGLKFKELKEVCVSLNEAGIAPAVTVKVGTKGEDMLSSFMDAIEAVEDKDVKNIPAEVSAYYDAIPQEAFDDDDNTVTQSDSKGEPVEEQEEQEEVVESDCPSFLTGCDDTEPDCQECKKDMPDEYSACKKATEAKASKKSKKKSKGTKNAGKRTRYGHMPNSMAGFIDDMVWKGHTKDEMVQVLMKEFGRSEDKAKGKVNSHLNTLINKKGITITEKKGDVLKAKQKYADGYDKSNTQKCTLSE